MVKKAFSALFDIIWNTCSPAESQPLAPAQAKLVRPGKVGHTATCNLPLVYH